MTMSGVMVAATRLSDRCLGLLERADEISRTRLARENLGELAAQGLRELALAA